MRSIGLVFAVGGAVTCACVVACAGCVEGVDKVHATEGGGTAVASLVFAEVCDGFEVLDGTSRALVGGGCLARARQRDGLPAVVDVLRFCAPAVEEEVSRVAAVISEIGRKGANGASEWWVDGTKALIRDLPSGHFRWTTLSPAVEIAEGAGDVAGDAELVSLAVRYLADHWRSSLSEGERLVLDEVGTIRYSKVAAVSEDEVGSGPFEVGVLGRIVVFGREVDGVPVIGSQAWVEFDALGGVRGMGAQWRRICGRTPGVASASASVVNVRMDSAAVARGLSGYRRVGAVRCGYVEDDSWVVQERVLPSCVGRYAAATDELSLLVVVSAGEDG